MAGGFHSYSQGEIRGRLFREFGQGYEVSGMGHYLVVHPAGKRDQWAPRFEELYRSFVQYFSARGWQLTEPRFPLVAVVYPREADFWQQAMREGMRPTPGVLGYYSPLTNRILMFDAAAPVAASIGQPTRKQSSTRRPISRPSIPACTRAFSHPPRWVVEGLGTMFEARGVWQSQTYANLGDRINRGRLNDWRSYAKSRRPADAIAQLVSSDRVFSSDPDGAYAEAWAFTFFLIESSPRKYIEYMAKTADRHGLYRLFRTAATQGFRRCIRQRYGDA